jgi:hypothetical protein
MAKQFGDITCLIVLLIVLALATAPYIWPNLQRVDF